MPISFKDQAGFTPRTHCYKGNLHAHTTNSDGHLTPAQAVWMFRRHGYSFLCLSEHDRYTDLRAEFDCPEFIILPGVEASANLVQGAEERRVKTHHIHGILGPAALQNAAERLFENDERLTVPTYREAWDGAGAAQSLSDFLRSRGCFTVYNHPNWSRVTPDEFIHTQGVSAVEVYNFNTVNECGTGYDTFCWDMALRTGERLNATASDDSHNEGLFPDALGGWICVYADELSHEAITQAILDGNYYSSSGPRLLDWGVRDGEVYVKTSPVERVNLIAAGAVGLGETVIAPTAEGMVEAYFRLRGGETVLRVECTDRHGKTAWSNPLYL